jgi:hypothetical protein
MLSLAAPSPNITTSSLLHGAHVASSESGGIGANVAPASAVGLALSDLDGDTESTEKDWDTSMTSALSTKAAESGEGEEDCTLCWQRDRSRCVACGGNIVGLLTPTLIVRLGASYKDMEAAGLRVAWDVHNLLLLCTCCRGW